MNTAALAFVLAVQAAPMATPDTAPHPAGAYRADGTSEGITMTRVADGIYQFTASADGYVEQTNATAIVGRRGVLIFDTNTRPSTARAVLAMLRTVTGRPVRWIVNSHWHPDHWGGNEVYADAFPGAGIVATEDAAQYMRNIAPSWPASFAGGLARFRETPPGATEAERARHAAALARRTNFADEMARVRRTYPTRTYRGALILDIGGRQVRLTEITGDASHSTIAFLPRERLLLSGDALVAPVSWTQQGYAISPWLESLRMLARLRPALIVPGHGPLMRDLDYLNLMIAYMDDARRQVRAALAAGAVTPDEVRAAVNLGIWRARFARGDAELGTEFDGSSASLVRKLYLEQRDGMESRR